MSSDIRANLWNFAYDLLDEPHRSQVIAQITSDPKVAREYVRTMQQIALLREVSRGGPGDTLDWQANDDNRTTVVFPDPLARERKFSSQKHTWGRRAFLLLATSLALWLLATIILVYWSENSPVRLEAVRSTWDRYAEHFPRMLVTGPVEFSPGVAASYQVLLQRIDGPPVNTRVSAELRDANEKVVWHSSRPTNVGGMIRFDVPPLLSPGYYQLSFDTPEIAPPFPLTELSQTTPFISWIPLHTPRPLIWSSVIAKQDDTQEWLLERRVDLAQLWPESDVSQWKELWEQQQVLPILARIEKKPLVTKSDLGSSELIQEKIAESLAVSHAPTPPRSNIKRAAQRPEKRWLVESLRYESGRVMNRFIIPHSSEIPVTDSEDAHNIPSQSWFDYSTVPPITTSVTPAEPQPLPLQSLKIEVEQELANSAKSDIAKIRVLDQHGHPVPCSLAITLDDREELLDERTMPRVWQQSNLREQLKLDVPPLVFDNHLSQQNHLENAFEAWRIDRDARRQFVALQVLIVSGLGYVLILCGSLLKYLPKVVYWFPAMLIYGFGFAMGTYWLTIADPSPPAIKPASLTNYGVRLEKPEDEELTSMQDNNSLAMVRETPATDIHNQEPIEIPTLAHWQAFFEQISLDQRQDNRWEFAAHSWVNNRWKRERPADQTAVFKQEDQLLAWHPFVYTNEQGEVSVQLPHLSDARPLRITVEAVGLHSLGIVQKKLIVKDEK